MASHKILVIDDSRVIRMRVRDMLPKGNFEVLEAKDGVEGLNLIRQERPNLIMLDFLLPRMSGWEVFQQIQNQSELQSIPLVVMSGRREEVTEKIPEPFEYFEFIEKPFEQKELIEAIKAAMAKAKLPRMQTAAAATTAPVATAAAPAGPTDSGASAAEIQALNEKIAKMQAEID
ncbi:MAG TPA: response regulator, partial [Candidatus Obscuribacterales bacterium]